MSFLSKILTKTITNNFLQIKGIDGYKALALCVTKDSTAPAILSNSSAVTIGGKNAEGVTIKIGGKFFYSCGDGDIDGLVITAPLGCTIKMAVSKKGGVDISAMSLMIND